MEEGGAKGQRKKEGRNLLRRGIYNNSSEAVTRLWPPPHPLKEDLKKAKSIVDWISCSEPQYDLNPMMMSGVKRHQKN
ncbi:hypothetical protein SAY87_026020 [Trapa incisa]|uniref:Uncharacterized protein n=1 Tax=Trapa incisa TaxID=236973 RepID=A0AAN7GLH1_9MYRT|nr:hypothetical protein SAY87_026020 [Trapa incisa]